MEKKDRILFLKKSLGMELAVIRMYEGYVHRVKDDGAKRALEQLICESGGHADRMAEMLAIETGHAEDSKQITTEELTQLLAIGLDEERGMESEYRRAAAGFDDPKARSVLIGIANDERRHQEILKKVSDSILWE